MISIVMAYHNRRQLLINTLKSIEYYNKGKSDFEIIIADDGSDVEHRIEDLPGMFSDLNIHVIWLDPEKKRYINPCIPYNIAFNFVTGDVILYQNTECLHVGDILSVIRTNSKKGTHLTFSLYSVNRGLQARINGIGTFSREEIRKVIYPMCGYREVWKDGDICWYNHSKYRRAFGSFIWSMMRVDLEALNGFDERYAFGFAWDDAEFTKRIERMRLQVRYSDDPMAIHQYHTPSDYRKMSAEAAVNRDLFHKFTLRERSYRAMHNTFYNK
jgi:glycosyltransferase involved in cell wall biosynthesis